MARSPQESAVSKLAKFFPAAIPVRLPVRLRRESTADTLHENTVIEFGTAIEVLFSSAQPLEFGDRIRLQNSDGSFNVEASVVAIQYFGDETAVAARFTQKVANWIVRP